MGDEYGIVLSQSGYVYGYGRNRYSQLGLGDKCFRCTPYEIGSKLGIDTTNLQVSSGGISFLVKEGELILKGWGLQSGMSIGNSSNQDAFLTTNPVSVLSDKLSINDPIKSFDFSRVSYVLLNSGSTYYWGYNNNYALGTNKTAGNVFVPFLAFTNRWQIVSSSRKNSCAKEIDSNRVYCWGYKGGLGDNATYPKTINSVYEPKLVAFESPIPNIIKIELGEGSAVALSDKGQVFTWGDNLYYTIGDGTQNPRKYPYHLKELDDKNIVEIHAFELFCVALSSDGKVYQWGELSRWRSDTYKFFATTPTLLNIPRNRKIKKVAGKQTFVIFISEFDEIIYTHYKIPDFRFLETSKHFKLIDISAKGEVALIYAQTDQCKLGYSNYPNCDTYECFGYQFNDVNVCSKGNGKCVAPDYCECSYGWEGNNCSTPYYVCNSTRMDDINVCSGRGECVGMDKCNCTNNGYVGKYCENIACNGIISTDDNVCSGHGLCIGPNNCSCTIDGYFGDNCSEFKCFGYLSTDSKACSGHGTCKSPNHCACDSSIYFGEQCERIITKSSSSVIIHRDDAGLIVGVLFGIITVIVFATLGIVAGIYFYKRYEKARGNELEHLALNNSL